MILFAAFLFVAQLMPPNSGGVTMGHFHLNVSDPAASRRFWVDLMGADPFTLAALQGVKLPGAVIIFQAAKPSGPTVGSVINHIGVTVKSLKAYSAKLTAAGFTVEPGTNPKQAMLNGPDGLRIELTEDESASVPIASQHIHWYTPDVAATQAWYISNFLAVPGMSGTFPAADLPGVNLRFTKFADPTSPTKGRALDHIGFEIKNLSEFCRELEGNGIRFDVPYRTIPELGISIAFLTDPWGTYIELTEGLDKAALK